MLNLIHSERGFQLERLNDSNPQQVPEELSVSVPEAFRDQFLSFAHFKYYGINSEFCKAVKLQDPAVQKAIAKLQADDSASTIWNQSMTNGGKTALSLIEKIENATSHDSFLHNVETALNYVCGNQELVNMFLIATCKGSIARILCTPPADVSDAQVLSVLLGTITKALSCLPEGPNSACCTFQTTDCAIFRSSSSRAIPEIFTRLY